MPKPFATPVAPRRKAHYLNIRVDDTVLEDLEYLSAHWGMSRANIIRTLITSEAQLTRTTIAAYTEPKP